MSRHQGSKGCQPPPVALYKSNHRNDNPARLPDHKPMTKEKENICRRCKFYYITWDVKHPHGCRAMGFKGKELPYLTVLKNSGTRCLLFEKKATPSKA